MLFDAKFVTHTDIYRHKKCLTIDPNSTFVDVTCAVRRKDSLCALARWFCVSRKGGWGHPQGDLHMLAVVAVCRNALVGTGWSNSCLVCTNRLRKYCSHLVGSSFLAGSASAERVRQGEVGGSPAG